MEKYILLLFTTMGFAINFSEDISPIIYENCTKCHRTGEIGSFLPFTNYEQVFADRYWIAYAIEGTDERHGNPIMPPWPPDMEYSNLLDAMYLTEDEIHTILEWVDTGAEQGNPENEYPMPNFPEGSTIGVPDVILTMEEEYTIEGNYVDDYRCFILETDFNANMDIAAIEFRPENLEAVHHALIVAVPSGSADVMDAEDPEYGYECYGGFGTILISDLLGGYAPGTNTRKWPTGLAQEIPENSDLIVQIHYAPLNTEHTDQSSINIFFKDEPVERYVQEHVMINFQFALPPNEITDVTTTWDITHDISLVQFLPHAHLLGKSWEIYANLPNNNEQIPLIKIDEWNFDWQFFYSPKYMVHLPAGTQVIATCTYDNTIDNPNNPSSPPTWSFWGEGTTDEMFFVPFRYVPYQMGDENIYLGTIVPGDLNGDNIVNVLDAVALVNIILFEPNSLPEADVNSDGEVNVIDVVVLVNLILG